MNNLNFLIFQGTTPTLELVLPFEMDPDDAAVATFRQGNMNRLEYGYNADVGVVVRGTGALTLQDDDNSVLLLEMTQADTLKLSEGDVEIQLRVSTQDGADAFAPIIGAVGPAFRKGELTP